MFSIREIFDLAMRIEENGEGFYRAASQGISNQSIRSMMEWLADQEARHRGWFAGRKNHVKAKTNNIQVEDLGTRILKDIVGDQIFSLKEVDVSKINTFGDLIAIAIEFERDTVLFYEMIETLVGDKTTAEQLSEIIKEEHKHISLLEDLQSKGEDNRGHENRGRKRG